MKTMPSDAESHEEHDVTPYDKQQPSYGLPGVVITEKIEIENNKALWMKAIPCTLC